VALPFWTRGDLNAFFGLGINMLVNVLVLAGLVSGSLATMIQSEAAVTPPHQLAPAHDVK